MQERIILMPNANGTELVRSLAAHGVCAAGLRICDSLEFARTGLSNSGRTVKGKLINSRQQIALISEILSEDRSKLGFFKPAAYDDARLLSGALDKLRLAADNDTLRKKLPSGRFADKNMALINALTVYEERLNERGLTDRVSVIRQAVNECRALDTESYRLAEITEYPLTPLERQLLDKLSGGKAERLTIKQLYNAEGGSIAFDITEAYGALNEVEDIINTIFTKKLPPDNCVAAVTDSAKYSQLFAELCGRYDIPFTLGCGTLLTSTYPAKLLELIKRWATVKSFGTDGLYEMIFSETFDRAKLRKKCFGEKEKSNSQLKAGIEMAGNMRLGWDAQRNAECLRKYRDTLDPNSKDEEVIAETAALNAAEKISAELEKGAAYILENYAAVRKNAMGRADKAARNKLATQLNELTGGDVCEVIPQLLTGFVCPENSRGGALHITPIENAYCSMRKELFIAGLSADNFPGTPIEDHLILDCDCIEVFGGDIPTSTEQTLQRKDILSGLIGLAGALGSRVRVSYYSYELSEMKDENCSSALEELKSEAAVGEMRSTGFFDSPLTPEAAVGMAYKKGALPIGHETMFAENTDGSADLRTYKNYSPSDIEVFFNCPKQFLLKVILNIEPRDSDDPLTVIDPRHCGTLMHKVMEVGAASASITRDELIALGSEMFDNYLLKRPPLNKEDAVSEKQEFLKMIDNALIMQANNIIEAAEKRFTVTHPESGITLTGFPDRVESRLSDKAGIIADFKTGRIVKHFKDDIDSCLQTVIYAYMIGCKGKKIEQCEYRYVRTNDVVTCRYDSEMKSKLDEKLIQFAAALRENDFECTDNEENCAFCRFGSICGKER